MTRLSIDTFGTGTPAVLVHGSLATGAEEWEAQRPLAEAGFRLIVPDRRGYGKSPSANGEDYLQDGDDIAELLGDGAHLVGHSYGCLGAMVAAARRPEATLSLALLEPPVPAEGDHYAEARVLMDELRRLWEIDVPDEEWLIRFFTAVGSDAEVVPPEVVPEALPLVPLLRHGRMPWDSELPFAPLASATFPKVVGSGGHSKAFDEICDSVADASGAVVEGAGHEIQFTGSPINGHSSRSGVQRRSLSTPRTPHSAPVRGEDAAT